VEKKRGRSTSTHTIYILILFGDKYPHFANQFRAVQHVVGAIPFIRLGWGEKGPEKTKGKRRKNHK